MIVIADKYLKNGLNNYALLQSMQKCEPRACEERARDFSVHGVS